MTTLTTSNKHIAKQPNAYDVMAGKNLRRIREVAGITQMQLGEALGISFQQIQKYEKGTNRLSVSRIVEACAFLNCTVGDIFYGTGTINGNTFVDPALRMPTTVVKRYLELTDAERKVINDLVYTVHNRSRSTDS